MPATIWSVTSTPPSVRVPDTVIGAVPENVAGVSVNTVPTGPDAGLIAAGVDTTGEGGSTGAGVIWASGVRAIQSRSRRICSARVLSAPFPVIWMPSACKIEVKSFLTQS